MSEGIRYFKASDSIIAKSLGDETVVLNLETGLYYTMQGTGSLLWRLLEQGRSIAEMAEQLTEECDVEIEEAVDDIKAFF